MSLHKRLKRLEELPPLDPTAPTPEEAVAGRACMDSLRLLGIREAILEGVAPLQPGGGDAVGRFMASVAELETEEKIARLDEEIDRLGDIAGVEI